MGRNHSIQKVMTRWALRRLALGPLALCLLTLCLLACGGAPSEPVAQVTVVPSAMTLPHGEAVQTELRWQLLPTFPAEAEGLYVFVHVLDADGEVVLTADHPLPAAGQDTFSDPVMLYHSALAGPIAGGDYLLSVGLYRPGGERFPLEASTLGSSSGRMEYRIANVTVPPVAPDRSLSFSEAWTPPTEGGDRQVRALRWLTEAGTVTVEGADVGGDLLLDLRLPAPTEGKQLLFEEGFDRPLVQVEACDDFSQTLDGLGSHRLRVPVRPDCEIRLTPSFYWVDVQTFARSSLILEQAGFAS